LGRTRQSERSRAHHEQHQRHRLGAHGQRHRRPGRQGRQRRRGLRSRSAKAAALASALGNGATAGTWGAAPAGDIVILAVLFDSAVPVVSQYRDALADKIIVDITNPFNPTPQGCPSQPTSPSRKWSPRPPPQAPMS
jgi:hypothetical protein